MAELLQLTIEELVALIVAIGVALTSTAFGKAVTGWLGDVTEAVIFSPVYIVKYGVRLAEWVASKVKPIYDASENRVSKFFAGHSQVYKYNINHAYRNSYAIGNVARWVDVPVRAQILAKALNQAEAANLKNALTKAPTLPQKRITQREVDIEFQKVIEKNFVTHLKQDFPKFDWDSNKWKKWLGVLPALGGAVVTRPKTAPTPVPSPKPAPVKTTVPIRPPQPSTLPHTDDSPNPEPGTQVVPGVVAAKDKWARGQIVTLKKVENNRWKHLGPLAFLALPIAGITTLIGLLECKNFARGLPKFCAMPSNLLSDLLALITDFLVLTNICTVLPWVEDAANEVLPFITEFTTGAAALACSGGSSKPLTLSLPTLQLPPESASLPALQLP